MGGWGPRQAPLPPPSSPALELGSSRAPPPSSSLPLLAPDPTDRRGGPGADGEGRPAQVAKEEQEFVNKALKARKGGVEVVQNTLGVSTIRAFAPRPSRGGRPPLPPGEAPPFAELHVPASRRGSRPSTSASSFSYPSTPALSEADSEISDVFRRLETLELQLREEREKRKETEREISRMLEAKASPPAKKKG